MTVSPWQLSRLATSRELPRSNTRMEAATPATATSCVPGRQLIALITSSSLSLVMRQVAASSLALGLRNISSRDRVEEYFTLLFPRRRLRELVRTLEASPEVLCPSGSRLRSRHCRSAPSSDTEQSVSSSPGSTHRSATSAVCPCSRCRISPLQAVLGTVSQLRTK